MCVAFFQEADLTNVHEHFPITTKFNDIYCVCVKLRIRILTIYGAGSCSGQTQKKLHLHAIITHIDT